MFFGGHGELVNTARRDRVMTGSIPVGHPKFLDSGLASGLVTRL